MRIIRVTAVLTTSRATQTAGAPADPDFSGIRVCVCPYRLQIAQPVICHLLRVQYDIGIEVHDDNNKIVNNSPVAVVVRITNPRAIFVFLFSPPIWYNIVTMFYARHTIVIAQARFRPCARRIPVLQHVCV